MLKDERQRYLLDLLHRDGKIVAAQASTELGISEDTIRRDLRDLAESGLLQRVHGGALLASPSTRSYGQREQQSAESKMAIASLIPPLLRNGQVIIIDGGTTTLYAARNLPRDLRATVITNSPHVAVALADAPNIEIVLVGGRLFKESLVTVGAAAVEAFAQVRADLCLLGVCSLHPDVGISDLDYEEAHIKRAMIRSSAEVVALASADKIDTASAHVVEPLTALTSIATEKSVPDDVLAPYRALGISILKA
jgi:DeoR/GlpR family transcriptional regulator of sugar metabolism